MTTIRFAETICTSGRLYSPGVDYDLSEVPEELWAFGTVSDDVIKDGGDDGTVD